MKPMLKSWFWLCAVLLAGAAWGETPQERDARMAWWQEARFGMFVHWGPVSLKGTEIGWSRGDQVPVQEYDYLYQRFNPTNFNARAWAKLARECGMRYLVLTSKHHDGFCLWNTRYSSYNIMNTPFGRDVTKELAEACAKEGLRFCLYHSICDWYQPDYPLGSPGGKTAKPQPNMDRYVRYLHAELEELLKNYGPLGILWFDGEWEKPWTSDYARELDAHLRKLQPSLIINNRIDKGRRDMAGTTAPGDFLGDYDTPEQQVGNFQNERPWESCITICQQWAWKPEDELKSLKQCLQTLVSCAGGDGNLLLNVGPMPNGEIEERQVARLREIGQWMKQYGHTVYGTRGGPFKPGKWGASTRRDDRIYLHVFQWNEGQLQLPAVSGRVTSCRVLTGGDARADQAGGLTIFLPQKFQREDVTVIELKLDGPAAQIPPLDVKSAP